ncbi:uncharacterized protein [Rutidosis leptorrhynchoides]|uniref:uncharacterized protein n=1 Tax=Rutidosis leptorrhynchoides TaxID=125765 RepID=UPI003A9A5AE0
MVESDVQAARGMNFGNVISQGSQATSQLGSKSLVLVRENGVRVVSLLIVGSVQRQREGANRTFMSVDFCTKLGSPAIVLPEPVRVEVADGKMVPVTTYVSGASIEIDEKRSVTDIPVVSEFPEVFPDILLGLPPIREFLGYVICEAGIKVDPSKIEAVMGWNLLKMPTEFKSFLGLAEMDAVVFALKLWGHYLYDYDCDIKYHPSKANVVADALSHKKTVETVKFMRIEIVSDLIEQIKQVQAQALLKENLKTELMTKIKDQLTDDSRGLKTFKNRIWFTEQFGNEGESEYSVSSTDRRMPTRWLEAGEKQFAGPELVHITADKVAISREKLKAARDRQKMQFEIIQRVNDQTFMLELPAELAGIHNTFNVCYLRKCKVDDKMQLFPLSDLRVDLNQKLVEEPVRIVDKKVTKLRKKEIHMVLVEWKHSLGSNLT